jgi:hypothetical protein
MATAKEQERALCDKLKSSESFRNWFLSKTAFAGEAVKVLQARSDNPWYQSPTTGIQGETDVFVVFEYVNRPERFALHIENKLLTDRFRPKQPELYLVRAEDWRRTPKWSNYDKFEIVLTAPRQFYERNKNDAVKFHRYISHEEIAPFIPEFANSQD